jgi:hypothetical protein
VAAPEADAPKADAPKADAPTLDTPKQEAPVTATTEAPATKAPSPRTPAAPAVTVTRGATPGTARPASPAGLLPADRAAAFRSRWREVQGDFVDDPQLAVRGAGDLAREVLEALAGAIADPAKVDAWSEGDGSTEDLRQALRQYRALVDKLLDI